jgi:hypothetical protein
MIVRKVSKKDIEKDDLMLFETCFDIIMSEEYEDLNEVQQKAQLCFEYEGELNFGGHLVYFRKYGDQFLDETIVALRFMGAGKQAEVLKKAKGIFLDKYILEQVVRYEYC